MFNIVNVVTQLPVAQAQTGPEAARIAEEWFNRTKVKHKPVALVNPNWYFNYVNSDQQLPHQEQDWWYNKQAYRVATRHYIQVSIKHEGEVEFFENDLKGSQGIRTKMGYGKYLERYFNVPPYSIGKDMVTKLASEFNAMFLNTSFGIATTSEEIEQVFKYFTGGYSCCIFKNWEDGTHPSYFIDPEEIQLAYIRGEDKAGEPSYTGRTLVRTKTKEFERFIKGDRRLYTFLEQEGWKPVDPVEAWVGVKARKFIGKNNKIKGMHLDYFNTFTDKGDHLVLAPGKGTVNFLRVDGYQH